VAYALVTERMTAEQVQDFEADLEELGDDDVRTENRLDAIAMMSVELHVAEGAT
jgi:hypothetical protein